MMEIPVLTYHSTNISGSSYHNNDHLALKQDLESLKLWNIEILSADMLVDWLKGHVTLDMKKKYTVITFDDGCELDFSDWHHPQFGLQQSFYSTLKACDQYVHATAFVIASATARAVLEKTCLDGHKIWGDEWWQKAEDSALISIENHSWDHLHTTLKSVKQQDNLKGDFTQILINTDANEQIIKASEYINSKIINKTCRLFAYPFGHINPYLRDTYFPKQQKTIRAAFSCGAQHVISSTNIWDIPRYVCGLDWKSETELKSIFKISTD
jgi:peptidoglycan/xylan/chitin deacetylase (PgdA/CDA1 family)